LTIVRELQTREQINNGQNNRRKEAKKRKTEVSGLEKVCSEKKKSLAERDMQERRVKERLLGTKSWQDDQNHEEPLVNTLLTLDARGGGT
jgi:hypothetical protein